MQQVKDVIAFVNAAPSWSGTKLMFKTKMRCDADGGCDSERGFVRTDGFCCSAQR